MPDTLISAGSMPRLGSLRRRGRGVVRLLHTRVQEHSASTTQKQALLAVILSAVLLIVRAGRSVRECQ